MSNNLKSLRREAINASSSSRRSSITLIDPQSVVRNPQLLPNGPLTSDYELVVIIIGARSLAALARSPAAAELRELVSSIAPQSRKRKRERPRALVAESGLERTVVELDAATIPRIADVAARIH